MKHILMMSKTSYSLDSLIKVLAADNRLDIVRKIGDIDQAKEILQEQEFDLVVVDYFGDEQKQMDILKDLRGIREKNQFLVLFPAWMAAFSQSLHREIEKNADLLYLPQDDQNTKIFKKDFLLKTQELCHIDPLPINVESMFSTKKPSLEVFEQDYILRDLPEFSPKILAFGASTGGPKALSQMVSLLPVLPVPIFITQHCAPAFIDGLLDMLNLYSKMPVVLGREGELIEPGVIYLAPGGYHMGVVNKNNLPEIELMMTPPENFSKPAVNPMLRSLAGFYKQDLLAVIMTGMGGDGLLGAQKVIEQGGFVFAQNQESSTNWDMPSQVIRAQFCSFVGDIPELALKIQDVLMGDKIS